MLSWLRSLRTALRRSASGLRRRGREQAVTGLHGPRLKVVEIDVDEPALVLDDAAGDKNRLDVGRVPGADDAGGEVVGGQQVRGLDFDDDEVGVLAGGDGAGLVAEAAGLRAPDGGELEQVGRR